MVKSRNQMILYLTAPLTEKYVYKFPSQREAWGSLPSFQNHILHVYFSRDLWENIFLRGKRRTDSDLISQLWKPYLRSSKLLACWNQLGWEGRSGLELGMVVDHGLVERGSSQVIRSSIQSSDLSMNCSSWVIECLCFQPLEQLQHTGIRFLMFFHSIIHYSF